MKDEDIVKIFKALSDKRRINIINILQNGEKCACDLLENLDMGQSGLSYHLKILVDSGLVNCRAEGKWSHYRLSEEGKETAKQVLDSLFKIDCNDIECSCKK